MGWLATTVALTAAASLIWFMKWPPNLKFYLLVKKIGLLDALESWTLWMCKFSGYQLESLCLPLIHSSVTIFSSLTLLSQNLQHSLLRNMKGLGWTSLLETAKTTMP